MRHIPLLVVVLATATLFTSCGEGGTTDLNGNGKPQVASVEVTPGADTLHSFGQTVTLVPVAKDAQGTTLTGQSFTWTSGDENVALVTGSGVVTANFMNGTATITATTGEVSGSAMILVEQVVASVTGFTMPGSMAWSQGPDSVGWNVLNHATTFAASTRDSLDNFIDRSDFSWASSDPAVVTIDSVVPCCLAFAVSRADGVSTITVTIDGVQDSVIVVVSGVMSQAWAFETGASIDQDFSGAGIVSTAAIATDGTLYVGSLDGSLYAVNSDGSMKWEFVTGGMVVSSPAIGADGTIYVGSFDGKIYAINPDGSKKWEFAAATATQDFWSSPAIAEDGTIYAGSIGGIESAVYAINLDGSEKWTFSAVNDVYSSAAVGADSTIYVGSADNKLYAISPDGSLKWEFDTGGDVLLSSPAIAADGTLYVGSAALLIAVNPDGSLKWTFDTGGEASSPTIGVDGTVYVGSSSFPVALFAVNPDGSQKWMSEMSGEVFSAPTIDADGSIFLGSENVPFRAFNPDGSVKWEFNIESFSSVVIATDGTLYVGDRDGKLYALSPLTGGAGLASSPWPTFRHDSRNTGNVRTP